MGKIKTRMLGLEDVEQKDKKEQKRRSEEKKLKKVKPEIKQEITDIQTKKTTADKKEQVKLHVRGEKYKKAKKSIDKTKNYQVSEAIELLKKIKYANFDESVELHLNVDQEGIKGEVELPNPTGKTIKVQIVDEKLIEDLEADKTDLVFDILITHPSFMPKLAKFAKILGPKGLMPNPKAGTISPNPEEVAKKFQKGSLRWKTEIKTPIIHQMVGKISFDNKILEENITSFIKAVGVNHILSGYVKTTMSPSIKLEIKEQ